MEFPWLHYNEQSDSVLCLNLRAARSKEVCFIAKGFSNWKKALAWFTESRQRLSPEEHQVYECHKLAIDYETNLSSDAVI